MSAHELESQLQLWLRATLVYEKVFSSKPATKSKNVHANHNWWFRRWIVSL